MRTQTKEDKSVVIADRITSALEITGWGGTVEFSSEVAISLNFTAEYTENAEAPENISND